MRLKPGTRLGRFEILGPIGSGGMGEVYRARDRKLGREVAVKVLPEWMSERDDARSRFDRETRAVAALAHPNVVTLHDVGTSGSLLYAVMELLEGESLKDRLERGPLPWQQAIRVAKAVADGLAAAHASGIVHRDVKPGNVFLTRTGHVKVLDFGLARLVQTAAESEPSMTATNAVLGTTGYMSPEQASGSRLDGRSDLFSLGCVLYEMLTGERPFQGETVVARMMATVHDQPPKLADLGVEVPPEVERILATCLAKRPEERFISAERLADALESLSAFGSGTLVLPPTTIPRPRTARVPWLVVAGALAVVAAAAVWVVTRVVDDRSLLLGSGWKPRQLTTAPGWEGEPAISPDGSLVAYTSDEAGNPDVWLLDLRAGDPLRLTDHPGSDRSPAWFPDGSSIVFASDRSGSHAIWKIARLGGSAVMVLPDAQDPAISPDGTLIAFCRRDASGGLRIGVAQLDNPSQSRVLTGPDDGVWDHRHPAWSPDGTTLCYHAQRNLYVVRVAGGKPSALTTDSESDLDPTWSPSGAHVYFSSWREGTTALWRVPATSGRPQRVTLGSGPEREPCVSPSGTRLLYSTSRSGYDVVVHDRDTGTTIRLRSARDDEMPAVAPDGSAVLFASDRLGGSGLWLQQLLSGRPVGAPRRLVEHQGTAATPCFSPDGRYVAYLRVIDGQRDIWILPVAGGLPVRLTDDPGFDSQPSFSPDGRSVAFVSDREGVRQVWVIPVSEGRPVGAARRVTSGTAGARFPCWSPDGLRLAWVADTGGQSDVWVGAVDGGGETPTQVTRGIYVHEVGWDPLDGALLVSGTWGRAETLLWKCPLDGSEPQQIALDPGFGYDTWGAFDLSRDGRVLAYVFGERSGDLWMLEGKPGRL